MTGCLLATNHNMAQFWPIINRTLHLMRYADGTRSCISVLLQFEFWQSFQANYYSNIHTITPVPVDTLRPRENGHHFADDSFKCIFVNEKFRIWNKISLKFVPKGQINNVPSLVQIMVWRRPGDKPLSEPMMVKSLTHICVTRPQWVKKSRRFWLDKSRESIKI